MKEYFNPFFFVIFFYRINTPDVPIIYNSLTIIYHSSNCGQHEMIGVIVFIHAISTDKKKIAGAAHNRIQQALYYCLYQICASVMSHK